MKCSCGRDTIDGKQTCGSFACGSSTGNTQSLDEMTAIAEKSMAKSLGTFEQEVRASVDAFEQKVRASERVKWAALLRRSAAQMRAWAGELRKARLPNDSEAATIHEREAVVWDCIADVIEDNNETPCVGDRSEPVSP